MDALTPTAKQEKIVAKEQAKQEKIVAKEQAKQEKIAAKEQAKQEKIVAKEQASSIETPKKKSLQLTDEYNHDDKYTSDVLRIRYNMYHDTYTSTAEIRNTTGLPIRHQNPPEDVTENIVKFIIQNYDNDPSCKWAKGLKLKGDLYSVKYKSPPEVKAFTSDGPSQFGPTKKFGVLYFLDMRHWINDILTLWRVNLTNESNDWKNIKMNKTETHEDQCDAGRRPHISWDKIYPQISDHCVKVYEGSFEGIFTPSVAVSTDSL